MANQWDSYEIEKYFDQHYSDLFYNDLKNEIKEIKLASLRCTYQCIGVESIDKECVESCQDEHVKFFKGVEKMLQSKIQIFQKCAENCGSLADPSDCFHGCRRSVLPLIEKTNRRPA